MVDIGLLSDISNKVLIQWGKVSKTSASISTSYEITLPTSFTTNTYGFSTVYSGDTTARYNLNIQGRSKTITTVGVGSVSWKDVIWMAAGY